MHENLITWVEPRLAAAGNVSKKSIRQDMLLIIPHVIFVGVEPNFEVIPAMCQPNSEGKGELMY